VQSFNGCPAPSLLGIFECELRCNKESHAECPALGCVGVMTAAQTVSLALGIVDDFDLFSVVTRGAVVVEQAILANSYLALSKEFDGTVMPHTNVSWAL
jgi:hypothetical protein